MFKPVRTAKWLAVSIIGWSFIAATLSGCIPANLGRMQTRELEITVETLTGSQCAQIAPLWWCNNIAQIQLKSVDFTPLPIEVRKSDQTHYLGHIAVEWSVPGEKAVCTHQWQLTWDKQRITALVAQEDNSGLPPLWVLEPVNVTTADNVTLMTGLISEGQSNAGNQAWDNLIPTVPLVQESVAAVEEAQLGELAQDWDHKAVVEVPSTVGIFAQMMDIPTAVTDQAAAVAHNCGFYNSAVHVIWNPDYEPYDEDEVKHTLTHEITDRKSVV